MGNRAAGCERLILEDLVYFGDDRGLAKGLAKALLQVAAARGLALTDAQRNCVTAFTDATTLERWLTRAATEASADDFLAGEYRASQRNPVAVGEGVEALVNILRDDFRRAVSQAGARRLRVSGSRSSPVGGI